MRRTFAFFLGLAMMLPLGCGIPGSGAADNEVKSLHLKMLAYFYQNYCESQNKPPANAEDLKMFAQDFQELYAALKSGQLVLIWNVDLKDAMTKAQKSGRSFTELVLGYESKVPASGGLVLLAFGDVKNMTAAEFAAAPKAQPKK